jgi:hypothetical protein
MSEIESMQEQLRQLLVAAKLTSSDLELGVAEANEELNAAQRTLQRESEAASMTQRALNVLREDVSNLQRIVDVSSRLTLLRAAQGPGAEDNWSGHLVVTDSGRPGFVLRVSHDGARAPAWQVTSLMLHALLTTAAKLFRGRLWCRPKSPASTSK